MRNIPKWYLRRQAVCWIDRRMDRLMASNNPRRLLGSEMPWCLKIL